MSAAYSGRQFVGIDLHRRRSVIVRMTETGERLKTVRILNDRDRLAEVMARAGECPEVVLEATYGWYWWRMRWPSWGRVCTWRTRCRRRLPPGSGRLLGCWPGEDSSRPPAPSLSRSLCKRSPGWLVEVGG